MKEKAQYFAQHWGQKAYCYDNHNPRTVDSYKYIENVSDKHYLLLTPLSQITKEDAIEVAEICFKKDGFKYRFSKIKNMDNVHEDILSIKVEYFISYPDYKKWVVMGHCQIDTSEFDVNFLRKDGNRWVDDIIDSAKIVQSYQYLQSKSYALEWNGYTVAQLIEKGWLKLKEV